MQLVEKYRPKRLGQVAGQDAIVRKLRAIMGRPNFDRGMFYLEGRTGTGKTSIARAIANELDAAPGWGITELDGSDCTVDSVRALDERARLTGLFADEWQVWIVNECHAMTSKAVQAWLTLLERWPRHWLVIFSTTENAEDLYGGFSQPFTDRCLCFRLTNQGLCKTFAKLAQRIASREGLNGRQLADYETLAKDCRNSMRAMLQKIEAGDMLA